MSLISTLRSISSKYLADHNAVIDATVVPLVNSLMTDIEPKLISAAQLGRTRYDLYKTPSINDEHNRIVYHLKNRLSGFQILSEPMGEGNAQQIYCTWM